MIFISTHTTGIAVMSKQIIISGLTFISVVFASVAGTHAELARGVNALAIKNVSSTTTNQRRNDPPKQQIASNSASSMRYVRLGVSAQRKGNERQALAYYYQAVQIDPTNAVAFLAAGNLLGETEDGVMCVKAAVALFQVQGNQEGYDLARSWLDERGIAY
jgi:tetratricopeptide (TPR) repeat protein